MHLADLKLSKSSLDGIPSGERDLLFLVGHLHNELSILVRLRAWSLTATPLSNAQTEEAEARTSQVLFLTRMLIGKIYEAKNTLRKAFEESDLRDQIRMESFNKFVAMMEDDDNMFRCIRNKLSFHTDDMELVKESIDNIPNDADLRLYSTAKRYGSYCSFADIGVHILMAKQTGMTGLPAISEVVTKSLCATKLLMNFLEGCLDGLIARHPGLVETRQRVELSNIEAFEEVSIPYFASPGGKESPAMPLTVRFPRSISGVE